jgi:hypothetical protein
MYLMQANTPWARALAVAGAVQAATFAAPQKAWAQGPAPVPYATPPEPVPYAGSAPPAAGASSVQRAPQAWQDTIVMKNGGLLRGTIIDAIPDAQARIQLATGEIATVQWGAIERIERGTMAPRLPPLPAPAAAAQPEEPSVTVWVHLEGSDGARLERLEKDPDGGDTWTPACEAPCDTEVPLSADYRIANGNGMRQSAVFHLHGQAGDHLTLTLSGGSKGWLVTGIVVTSVSGLVMLVGSVVALAGSASTSSNCGFGDGCTHSNPNAGLAAAGWLTLLVGAAAAAGGIVLIVHNARTGVAVDVTGAQSARVQGDAWAHVPTWHEPSAADRALPPVLAGPIWSGRF